MSQLPDLNSPGAALWDDITFRRLHGGLDPERSGAGRLFRRGLPATNLVEIAIPAFAEQGMPKETQIGAKCGASHVLQVHLEFSRADELAVAVLEML